MCCCPLSLWKIFVCLNTDLEVSGILCSQKILDYFLKCYYPWFPPEIGSPGAFLGPEFSLPAPCFHFLIFFFSPRSSIKLTSFCQNSGSSLLSSPNPHSLSTSFCHLQQHFPAEYYMRAFRQTSRFVARNLHFIIKEKSNRKCF